MTTGFAIRNDGLGWRAVSGADDCAEAETFSETPPVQVVDLVEDQKKALLDEIDHLERDSLMNRGVRELSLRQMEFMAQQLGEDLTTVPAYVKFKALDEQITALREEIWTL